MGGDIIAGFIGSAILHAETDAIENAGRLKASDYRRAVLYSTLSPCDICSGMTLLDRISKIVIGENRTFRGPEDYVWSRRVIIEIVDDPECVRSLKGSFAVSDELLSLFDQRQLCSIDLPLRHDYVEELGSVDLRKLGSPTGFRRPFHRERVAGDGARSAVALECPSVNDLAPLLL